MRMYSTSCGTISSSHLADTNCSILRLSMGVPGLRALESPGIESAEDREFSAGPDFPGPARGVFLPQAAPSPDGMLPGGPGDCPHRPIAGTEAIPNLKEPHHEQVRRPAADPRVLPADGR